MSSSLGFSLQGRHSRRASSISPRPEHPSLSHQPFLFPSSPQWSSLNPPPILLSFFPSHLVFTYNLPTFPSFSPPHQPLLSFAYGLYSYLHTPTFPSLSWPPDTPSPFPLSLSLANRSTASCGPLFNSSS